VSISSPSGENHLPKTVTVSDSLSSARNYPLGKPDCCCLFFVGCLFVSWSALVDLILKADLVGSQPFFFATAELMLFSTVFQSRAVDLFFDSGVAAGAIVAVRQPGSGDVARLKFLQSWRECGFRVAPLHALRGEKVAVDIATFGSRMVERRFQVSFGY